MRRKKNGNSGVRKERLAKPGELDVIIIPARKALDAITSAGGFSAEDAVSLSLFANLAELVARHKNRSVDEVAAQRLAISLKGMLEEAAIDEDDLDRMKDDFFRLTLLIQSFPIKRLWGLIHELSKND